MAEARIVVMGPSGSGKSLVGSLLAERLGVRFVDADDLHPAANVAKMAAGTPLDDADRMPWLDRVAATLHEGGGGIVVACSALARRYRNRIRSGSPGTAFVELVVSRDELERRMLRRTHFMPAALLESQLETLEHLEPDEPGVAVPGDRAPGEIVELAVEGLAGRQSLR
ncbi:gluconokinase [Microbacterium immunditiarum]|uniref:Gluconokinase n=1 Tax=Microbacterium immunditiarum TaxID=337480 RepID=A0A7Y9KJL3_9MICO|nr:gluconokinase [Microbacterium immunditiarum]NYE19791.1 carbohydrate kinase (thermoresistant glucokinase family) [Microbacterium immunditiarum]